LVVYLRAFSFADDRLFFIVVAKLGINISVQITIALIAVCNSMVSPSNRQAVITAPKAERNAMINEIFTDRPP
jgi:hypothetical protein